MPTKQSIPVCPVCREEIKQVAYVCPGCSTIYCIKCAIMKDERKEPCIKCQKPLQFGQPVPKTS